MSQISFTLKNQHVYDRFSRLLLEEQLKRGKLTAPQFLDLVLDAFQERQAVIEAMQDIQNLQPVRIKDSDNRYISDVGIETANFDVTSYKDESMIFDSHDEARAFLRKWGRSVENWILEPANESK